MRLSELIADLPVVAASAAEPDWSTEVTGVAHDSRRVRTGDLFIAMQGAHFDGRRFADEAVARGAAAVLAAPPGVPASVPSLVTEDPRAMVAPLAARVYAHPERELLVVGITGTNGKSTVTRLVAAMLEAAGRATGVLGTLGYTFRDRRWEGERTTPEASDLFRTLREMIDVGAAGVSMEVSSHALMLGRVTGLAFDVALFTNLSRDHLDFHGDMETYFAAKMRLFDQLRPSGRAVVNVDDPYGRRLAADLEAPLTFGTGGEVDTEDVALDLDGIRGRLRLPSGTMEFSSPLLGRYNLSNIVAAVAAAEALALGHDAMVRALAGQAPIPGRLERVPAPFPIFIDYAHTPSALEAALQSLRELSPSGVALVFGCGGDRDPGKRPLMGRIAGELAEVPILTADNPRGEDPDSINAAVEAGLRQSGNWDYQVIPDRREAIRAALAVAAARPEIAVLVAGKGHEAVQIIGSDVRPFSDRREVERALEGRALEDATRDNATLEDATLEDADGRAAGE